VKSALTRRLGLRVWVLVWLMLVWILLWGNFSWANVLSGFAVAVLIRSLLALPAVPVEGRLHPLALLQFVWLMAWYLVQSSMQVAWLAVKPGPPPHSAVLRAGVSVKSDLVLALLVNAINLTPGTMVVEIDKDRRTIYVHVLDVGSPRAVDRFFHETTQMERLLINAFERDADWRPVGGQNA
jgi:multicomponent Na+:H+ antiporter subunit E